MPRFLEPSTQATWQRRATPGLQPRARSDPRSRLPRPRKRRRRRNGSTNAAIRTGTALRPGARSSTKGADTVAEASRAISGRARGDHQRQRKCRPAAIRRRSAPIARRSGPVSQRRIGLARGAEGRPWDTRSFTHHHFQKANENGGVRQAENGQLRTGWKMAELVVLPLAKDVHVEAIAKKGEPQRPTRGAQQLPRHPASAHAVYSKRTSRL